MYGSQTNGKGNSHYGLYYVSSRSSSGNGFVLWAESIETLTGGVMTLVDNCILGLTANKEHCLELLEHSVGMVTALCPFIGYKKASEIAKESLKTGVPVRKLVVQKGIVSADEVDEILNPFKLTFSEKEREELEQFTKAHK